MARVIDLSKMPECTSWGYQGESGATILVADTTEFANAYPNGKPNVIFQRQDGHPYIHKFTTVGENLFIELNSTDTQQQGKCEVQISWIASGNRIMKKNIYRSFILPADLEGDLPLTEESIMMLDQLENYVDEAKELLSKAQQYASELVFVDVLPEEGEQNKLYISKDTNGLYFWNGEVFMLLNPQPTEIPDDDDNHCCCHPVPPPPPPPPSRPDFPPIGGGDSDDEGEEIFYGGNAFYPKGAEL